MEGFHSSSVFTRGVEARNIEVRGAVWMASPRIGREILHLQMVVYPTHLHPSSSLSKELLRAF